GRAPNWATTHLTNPLTRSPKQITNRHVWKTKFGSPDHRKGVRHGPTRGSRVDGTRTGSDARLLGRRYADGARGPGSAGRSRHRSRLHHNCHTRPHLARKRFPRTDQRRASIPLSHCPHLRGSLRSITRRHPRPRVSRLARTPARASGRGPPAHG